MTLADAGHQMVEISDPAGRNYRYGDTVGNGLGQRQVEALAGAVAVHAGQEDFAGAERDDLLRVFDGIDPCRLPPTMGEDLPAVRPAAAAEPLGVDRNHEALPAEFLRAFLDDLPARHRSAVDRDLVGSGAQQG